MEFEVAAIGDDAFRQQVMTDGFFRKGYTVISSFKCLGRFLFANRGHPNEDDLKNARAFANRLKNM